MAGFSVGGFWSGSLLESPDELSSGRPPHPMEVAAVGEALSAQQRERERADRARRVISNHFNNLTNFRYEDVVGSGVFGVAYSIIEKRFGRRRSRRLVVKRAQTEAAQRELIREIRVMSLLNGSAHIARVYAANTNDQPVWHRPGIFRRAVAKILSRRKDMLVGLPGPSLVLEHLENGTLTSLQALLEGRNRTLPNRVLWSFYLCLVRACVAMKFPPGLPLGAKPKLEEIPADQSAPASIIHGDMHSGNVLIGSAGDFPEHTNMPPIKLIDFGLSLSSDEQCDERNLLDVSKQIYFLIIRRYHPVGSQYEYFNGIVTMATEILPRDGQATYPLLDDDLRDLVARCLARNPAERPSLAEALVICKNAVETKTPGAYGFNAARETDYFIRILLQELVYNAS